jgi:lambda family phage portal protein
MSEIEKKEAMRPKHVDRRVMLGGGYGAYGGNTSKTVVLGWNTNSGSAEDDIDLNASKLRQRSRDLDAGGGIARAANVTMTTSVVGPGLLPKPKPKTKVLGITEDAAKEWAEICLNEFEVWAGEKTCSADLKANFSQLQQLAMKSQLVSGDCFALLPLFECPGTPYQTHIRLLEADRISTPDSSGESTIKELTGGAKIVDGIEIDAQGVVKAYHIASRHPLASSGSGQTTYTKVEAYGKDTGMPNVLHLVRFERPEQRRGVPFIAAMILTLKQMTRYTEAELMACVVNSFFTVFIQQQADMPGMPDAMEDVVAEGDRVTQDEDKIELGAGAIIKLKPGETINTANPGRPNGNFDKYVEAMCILIAASLGISKSILLKKFESNYTAARGELLEFWKEVKTWRSGFIDDFCKPAYEAFLAEAVALGRIQAPGFFDDPAIRHAWCKAEWIGTTMGQIDPLKEVKAARERMAAGLSTGEREAAEMNGSDFTENMMQRDIEIAMEPKQEAKGNGKPAPAKETEEEEEEE